MHLQALERNEPDALPARPFLQGYLRSCAAVLDLDAEQLLAAYQASEDHDDYQVNKLADEEVDGASWSAYSALPRKSNVLLRLGTMVVLPLFAISALAWAYHVIDGKLSSEPISTAEFAVAEQPDSLGPLASTLVTAQSSAAAGSVSEQIDTVQIDTVNASESEFESFDSSLAVASLQTQSFEMPTSDTGLADETVLTTQVVRSAEPVLESVTQGAPIDSRSQQSISDNRSPGAAAMVAQYQQRDRLVIWVNEDSWIDVSDEMGNRLYRNLARAGKKIEVSGNLPFSMHIGNAPGLSLELNGEAFAITNYRDDNSARLTLGSR